MASSNFKMEVLAGPERRRRWSTAEKLAIIHETYEADAMLSLRASGLEAVEIDDHHEAALVAHHARNIFRSPA